MTVYVEYSLEAAQNRVNELGESREMFSRGPEYWLFPTDYRLMPEDEWNWECLLSPTYSG